MIAVLAGCGRSKSDTGRSYMPDMAYSRAYETYATTENLEQHGINYKARPVEGTIARGDEFAYTIKNDEAGYAQSAVVKSPLDAATINMTEAERLYLINCGVCHGTALDGNGPLWKNGEGAYPAAPRPLNADYAIKLTDGHYFHVITYGKGAMGSYASQLKPEQRWWVIKYIRSKQTGAAATDSSATAATSAAADSAKTKQP